MVSTLPDRFRPFLRRWTLTPDGPAIRTPCSDLLPVRWQGQPAMLKVARIEEERVGNRLMVWWDGRGAARVYAHDDAALLMERVEGELDLTTLALTGQDDEATRLLCRAVRALHAVEDRPWPDLPDLKRWFRALGQAAGSGPDFADLWHVAQACLSGQMEVRPLHGDIHHGNVLHSRERGWVVIDPKGLIGDRAFEYANILCNPTLEHALSPGRLERQLEVIASDSGLNRFRLARWTAAYAGLSAAWHLEDGAQELADLSVRVARRALAVTGA